VRVTAKCGVVEAMRLIRRQAGTVRGLRPSVAGVGSIGTQGKKFREDWSLWQRR
jgi:hypothetical protein